jgi:hypothetical protein
VASGPRAAGQGIVELGAILAIAAAVAVVVLVLFRAELAFVLSLVDAEIERVTWLPGLAGVT